tara:strand:- start:1662 stop:1820 length:159 start_codon:yes stop_codon:yes gene_type:complete
MSEKREMEIATIIYVLLIIGVMMFSSCKTKNHVITEYDGERIIHWYGTEEEE